MPNDKSNVSRKSKFSQNIINLKALELAINARQGSARRERGSVGAEGRGTCKCLTTLRISCAF